MNSKMALMSALGMALAAGAVLPFQAAANANVGRALGHPLWGATASLTVSVAVIVPLLLAVKAPSPNVSAALHGPWWLWVGGVLGALYAGSATVLTPKLGAGSFLVAVVAGWHAVALWQRMRAALPSRFRLTIRYYIAAGALLPVGALLVIPA